MHISELRIRNFRNFKSARFCFNKGVNTLIGENGAGKTNAMYALRLLLDETLPRNASSMAESDFSRALARWRGHWIVISLDFKNLDPAEGCQILKHFTAHMDGTNNGTLNLYFRPKLEIRHQLYELSGTDQLDDYRSSLTIDDYETVFMGRGQADFLDEDAYSRVVYDDKTDSYPDPQDDDQDFLGVRVQPLHQEVACTFVRALRDVVSDLKNYRGNPLLNLLRGLEKNIEISDAESITELVDELNTKISTLDEVEQLSDGIETALSRAVGSTYAPSISIASSLPSSIERLLQRLSVLVGDSQSDYRGDLQEQSLGGANLIYLALKLLEYENKLSSDRAAHFLLIEEPESHIHTHIQKALFSNLPTRKTQVIVSTHSTHISSAAKIASVNVLAKKGELVEVYQPSAGLESEEVARIERYLDAVRSTLLFAKGVVLVEGDAEQILIPAVIQQVFGMTVDEMGFSIISMSSAFFENLSQIFSPERIQRPCSILTDLDDSILQLPSDPNDDTNAQKHARASMSVGANRKKSLDKLTESNPWINAYYANYTFEVDFLNAGNGWEIKETLNGMYTRATTINRSTAKLDSKDLGIAGTEVLRLADKQGKGWFALLLSEAVFPHTLLPEYILEAVAFASHQSVNTRTLKKMGLYRVKTEANVDAALAEISNLPHESYMDEFNRIAPTDDLSKFYRCLQRHWA
jgi:putative ATP-dependent endonuclease of OLD family